MIAEAELQPLLSELQSRATPQERLLLIDALARLHPAADAWRAVSRFAHALLDELIDAGAADTDVLSVLASTPLMSVRQRLRQLTEDKDQSLALPAALALAAQHDAGGLARLLDALETSPNEGVARAIAILPFDALQSESERLKHALACTDPMVRMWIAIAIAKARIPGRSGSDFEPLEQLWDALVRPPEYFHNARAGLYFREPPPLFGGDPSRAANELAHARPLPAHLRTFLLGLKENDFDGWTPRSQLVANDRDAKILIAGLTGEYDIYGDATITPSADTPAAPTVESTAAALSILQRLKAHPWRGLEVDASADELQKLKNAPPALAAQTIEAAIETLPQPLSADSAPPPWVIGNALLHLAIALPAALPLRIAPILENSRIATLIPRGTLAWVLARAGADATWQTLAPYIAASAPTQRRDWLTWLRDIAYQIDAPAPFTGAGGGAASESVATELIDDLPRRAMRSAPPPPTPPPSLDSTGAFDALPDAMAADAGSDDAVAAAAPAASAPPADVDTRSATAAPTQPREVAQERFLQGDLYRKESNEWIASHNVLALSTRYKLNVFIGAAGIGAFQAKKAFPDDQLDWQDADRLQLRVVFTVLDGRKDAQTGTLELPRTGTSSICGFEFTPLHVGPVRLRIAVLYKGRILQTAIIDCHIVATLAQAAAHKSAAHSQTEMIVHDDLSSLRERRAFDASLLLNHTASGSATATAAAGDGAYVSSLDESLAQLEKISELLQEIANKSKLHTKKLRAPANESWLARLAREGHYVYRNLVLDYIDTSTAAKQLREARYLQIVTARPDAVVPLEFVYEFGFPNKNAKLCDGAEKALQAGRCPKKCQLKEKPEEYVCPLGFWGLSRVIERHVHDPSLQAPAVIKSEGMSPARKQLVLQGASLLAASEQVPKKRVTALSKKLQSVWRGGVSVVEDWPQWLKAMQHKPVLFVVLPHAHGAGQDISLEINGHSIESARIDRPYVYPHDSTGSPPIVLLLGCNTAGVANMKTYAKHITVFRQAQSAIVLATTAAVVWGDDIAQVAEELLEQFQDAARESQERFGDILRDAKCQAVLDSQLVAICLAAIGDADWQLKIPDIAPPN